MGGSLVSLFNFKTSVLKKKDCKYIYIYNKDYYCLFKISGIVDIRLINGCAYQLSCSGVELKTAAFLRQFFLCSFSKVKFTGKGYKIKKNSKKSVILLFNRAHITIFWWNNFILKKLKKYKMYIRHTNRNCQAIKALLGVRNINIFTKKGLRSSRQILYKKKGKK